MYNEGILHHKEGVDIIPTNIELSGMEISLVNAMSREQTLKLYLADLKKDYDYILIDCMPSLGMLTINALNCRRQCNCSGAGSLSSTKRYDTVNENNR